MKIIPKGMLKFMIILELKSKPLHGYEIIKRIEARTGFWKPSPGTVYPVLKNMVDEKIIYYKTEGKKKVYYLTKKGRYIAKKISKKRKEMRSKFIEVFSKMMDIDKKQLSTIVKAAKRNISKDDVKLLTKIIFLLSKSNSKKIRESLNRCISRLERI